MNRANPFRFPSFPHLGWRALEACAVGLPLLGLGCAGQTGMVSRGPLPVVAAAEAAPGEMVQQVRFGHSPASDQGMVQRAAAAAEDAPQPAATENRPVPISLDAVLRMAEEQNNQVAIARERLREANVEKDIASLAWLPNLYVGTTYYRHEGGIQNERGDLIHSSFGALFGGLELHGRFDIHDAVFQKINAERRVLQHRGELSKITSETLLEATSTYLDLLQARSSAAAIRESEKLQADLLKRALKILEAEPGTKVQVEALLAEARGRRQAVIKVDQQGDAAAAKLGYLLGLDPCTRLVPVDPGPAPFELIDANQPLCQLVELALTNGPGVMEMERLLALIMSGLERSKGPAALLPTLEMRMAEGGFGAGRGSSLDWDNRWDLALQARWDLRGLALARDRQRAARSKLGQAQLSYQDLRGKLAAGVQEAREAVLSGRQQIDLGREQLKHAQEAHRLTKERLEQSIPGSSINEVREALRGLDLARIAFLAAISAHDKAQLRLMILLGPASCARPGGEVSTSDCHWPAAGEQRQ